MPLSEFLLKKTNARELCVICVNGWINATFFIDHEDLFVRYLSPKLAQMRVKKDYWDTLSIVDAQNKPVEIPCHFVEV